MGKVIKMDEKLKLHYSLLDCFIKEQSKPLIIAIEGKCASGKTTLANLFKDKYTIIHIDDFFLPESKKTKERLLQIGGNINYEAVFDLLVNIKEHKQIAYQKFDCHNQTYSLVNMPYNEVIILEGVYSYHPYFNQLVDKLVYFDINEETQFARIKMRPNFKRFFSEWIPLENNYYKHEKIITKADLVLKND